jgi:L-amino acid N-acyltransferase YncA
LAINMSIVIRPATVSDSEAIARIYNHYIRESVITFEENEVSPQEMATRVEETMGAMLPWLVVEDHGVVAGYAYANKWKARSAYRFAVESTVYLDQRYTGKGVGTKLYQELLGILRTKSLHVVIGGIAQPNAASVALHERLGFEKVAHFKEVGFKFGQWVDVGYWQLAL